MSRKWVIILGTTLVCVVAIVITLSVWSAPLQYVQSLFDEPIEYEQGLVSRGDIESVVVATGALEPVNEVIVGSEISGLISELHADFNDAVEEAQLLARIDPRTFESRRQQRLADVEVAKANIQSRNADLNRSKANLDTSRRLLERRLTLQDDSYVSETQLDTDRNAVAQNIAGLEIAEASVETARASLVQAEAALAQAELDLERTYIRSPTSGTVINRNVELGQTVAASFSAPELFLIAHDLHEMKVEASVDEADIGRIRSTMKVRFSVDAYPDREFTGEIMQVRKAPSEEQNVVTYKVIINARNDDLALLPGMTANVEIILGERNDVLKIPNAALRYTPRGATAQPIAQSANRGGAGAGGRGRGPMNPEDIAKQLQEELGLSDDVTKSVERIQTRLMDRMRAMFSQSGGPPQAQAGRQQQMRSLMENATRDIEALLTDEQRLRYRAMFQQSRGRGSQGRPETVWVMNDTGLQESRNIVVGLADDSSTEVIRGLEEGDEVIVRARRTGA